MAQIIGLTVYTDTHNDVAVFDDVLTVSKAARMLPNTVNVLGGVWYSWELERAFPSAIEEYLNLAAKLTELGQSVTLEWQGDDGEWETRTVYAAEQVRAMRIIEEL